MTPRPARPRSPVVVKREPRIGRRPSARAEMLDPGALETPLPGSLLVLLSRLHRAEARPADERDPAA